MGGLVVLCSGVIPGFALPFLVEESWGFKLAAALCLGLVASAMSPAATIAVVHETGSKGPITDSVMGISILNNVIVVVLFAFGLSIAGVLAPEYYTAHSEHSVAATLATSIGGAAVLGGVLGIGLALYIRTLGKELLLIITGLCFTLTWVAQQTGIDPVLSFIVAGFVARNAFPKEEISLSRIITKLSLPVYVVFFFLAGAGLHIDAVIQLWPFALLLFGGRLLALYLGTRIGSNIGKGPEGLKSYGWLGFGAQAGIALSMAKALEHSFGETGLALETLAVAGVALNELCGPVLLKICLGIAGETQTQTTKSLAPPSQTEKDPPIASESAEVETPSDKLPEWIPESQPGLADPWGAPPTDHHKKVLRIYRNSRAELQSLVRDLRDGPVTSRRQIGRDFIAQLRREFLRYHRRCLVIARDPNTQRDDFIAKLASHRAQLAARWQDHILDRSAMANYRVEKEAIDDLIRAVDALIAGMPVSLVVPMDPELLQPHENDSVALRARMWMVRTKGGMGDRDPERSIEVENLARYTFGSELTDHLHQVAALLAVTDRHLMSRARNIFEVYRRSLAQAVQSEAFQPGSWDEVLNQVRKELEEEFDLALAEVDRLAEEAVRAASIALASPHQSFSNLLKIAGSPRLPPKAYQASKVYDQRVKAVERIHQGLESARGLSRGVGNGLAMELELVRLQTRVRSLIQDRAREFGRDLHGRAALQATQISRRTPQAH